MRKVPHMYCMCVCIEMYCVYRAVYEISYFFLLNTTGNISFYSDVPTAQPCLAYLVN